VLKKCYFETYRFSEDLDFSIGDVNHISEEFLRKALSEVADWVYQNSGIEVPSDRIKVDIHPDPAKKYVEGRIYYQGPLGRARGSMPRIILDLSANELIALPSVKNLVYHPYSDAPQGGIQARSYGYEEVFAEKVRALAQRSRPRDLYDVIHLYRHEEQVYDKAVMVTTLKRKCDFKEIPVPTFEFMEKHPLHYELEQTWESMLRHQLAVLPPWRGFWDELPDFFSWLNEEETIAAGGETASEEISVPGESGAQIPKDTDLNWTIPPRLIRPTAEASVLERIRFAAANRLCIEVTYSNKGKVDVRAIEPYSVRRTIGGELYLAGVRADSGESRSYKINQIRDIAVTERSFNPRRPIEIGYGSLLGVQQNVSSAGSRAAVWPKYIYRCSACGRLFTKTTMNPALREHKNKRGSQCYGRHGYYVRTRYR
jgi:predicted nucleotidyltransferase component of viral defense system